MPLLVTSAFGVNGDGYGTLLAFDRGGAPLGVFCDDPRINDPRGLTVDPHEGLLYLNSGQNRILALRADSTVVRDTGPIEDLNPGGGNFGPDGRYYVGLRSQRTITAFPRNLDAPSEHLFAPGIVPFPRGFAFSHDGRLFLSSGIGPMGKGDNSIIEFAPNDDLQPSQLVSDPELSPLDLAIAPNGNIVVSSEHPFGAPDAVTTVREYDAADGHLVRLFRPDGLAEFRRPRGLRFDLDGNLYCVAQDEVVAFDFTSGKCLGSAVQFPRLYGQALAFFP
jgi:hypothetical protein